MIDSERTHEKRMKRLILPGDLAPSSLVGFKEFLTEHLGMPPAVTDYLPNIGSGNLYEQMNHAGIKSSSVARFLAEFFKLPYVPHVDPKRIQSGVFPKRFSKERRVLALRDRSLSTFVLSDPFDTLLLEILELIAAPRRPKLFITEPENITALFGGRHDFPQQGRPDGRPLRGTDGSGVCVKERRSTTRIQHGC